MSKRPVAALVITVAALVLLLNFRTPDVVANGVGASGQAVLAAPAATSSTPVSGSTAGTGTSSGQTSVASGTGSTSSGTASSSSGTFTGTAVDTRYGPVQVQVTVQGGKITAVEAIQYPSSDPHSMRVNQYAIPALVQEALQAQSAQVNTVSGATYTSEAFIQSLQSALTAANV